MENTLALLNGAEKSLADGAVVSVISILLVFALLALIIAITYVISIVINKYSKKETKLAEPEKTDTETKPVNLEDEDARIAVLIASIDYRNETKKNIKVKSVKEI